MTNPYCEVLGIDVPRLADVIRHREAKPFNLLLVALLEEGGPLTLAQVADRLVAAGRGPRATVERSLVRSRPGRKPIYRHGERYFLDPYCNEADLPTDLLGLRPPRWATDGGAESAPEAQPKVEPAPLPGPDVPLQPSELEEAWSAKSLWSWSAQRIALCVLDAYGSPMRPEDAVAYADALEAHHHRLSVEQPYFANKKSPIKVLEDGRWELVPDHRFLRAARKAIRDQLVEVRSWPRTPTREEQEEWRREYRAEKEAKGLEHAPLRRAILRGFPLSEPAVLTVIDVDTKESKHFAGDALIDARAHLESFDVWAGEEIRPLLEGLGIDFAARRLHELRPPQKTIVRNDRGNVLQVTMKRLLKSSCGIERPWKTEEALRQLLDRGQTERLLGVVEDEARDLAALYRYGRLHGALRITWRSLDDMIPVPWVHRDEWWVWTWARRAEEASQPVEIVVGDAPAWDEPWAESLWCTVLDPENYRSCLVTAKREIIQFEDVQCLRMARPGPWHAPLPAEAAGPSLGAQERSEGGGDAMILRIRVELDLGEVAPPVWRTIEVPSEASFWDLHVAIQDAMGWKDYHLHAFRMDDPETGEPIEIGLPLGYEFVDEVEPLAGWLTPVLCCLNPDQPECEYVYDYGDDWHHRVRLEAIAPRDPALDYPRCVDGARACPPEDVGGRWGFERFLAAIADPEHEEHASYVEWVGGSYDAAAFDATKVTFDEPGERWVVAFRLTD